MVDKYQLAIEKINAGENVLFITSTEGHKNEIRDNLIEINNGCMPKGVYMETWYPFLLTHGARPYQDCIIDTDFDIKGVSLAPSKTNYFSKSGKIYSDKLAKFAIRCNKDSGGKVIWRISKCFDNIFIDEAQAFAGYDLEFLKLLKVIK